MFGAFFKQINALHRKGVNLPNHTEVYKQGIVLECNNDYKNNASYFVLQGLPTTITLTLRDATALRAFPCSVQIRLQ